MLLAAASSAAATAAVGELGTGAVLGLNLGGLLLGLLLLGLLPLLLLPLVLHRAGLLGGAMKLVPGLESPAAARTLDCRPGLCGAEHTRRPTCNKPGCCCCCCDDSSSGHCWPWCGCCAEALGLCKQAQHGIASW
jgi:hypothetical protein